LVEYLTTHHVDVSTLPDDLLAAVGYSDVSGQDELPERVVCSSCGGTHRKASTLVECLVHKATPLNIVALAQDAWEDHSYSLCVDPDVLRLALTQAKGSHQENILRGSEALSGSTLRGTAKGYGNKYANSTRNLLCRLTDAGVPWFEGRGARVKRVLVLGAWDLADLTRLLRDKNKGGNI